MISSGKDVMYLIILAITWTLALILREDYSKLDEKHKTLKQKQYTLSAGQLDKFYESCMAYHDGVQELVVKATGEAEYRCRDGHLATEESHTYTREIKEIEFRSW